MAITITSKYTPLSYEQKIAPLMAYKQEYEKMLDEYTKIQDTAGQLEYIAQAFPNDPLVQEFQRYRENLDIAADKMSKGLYHGYKKDLAQLQSMYNTVATPMSYGFQQMMTDASRVQQLKDKDPDIFTEEEEHTILDYAKNPSLSTQIYNGKNIREQVTQAVSPIAQRLVEDPSIQAELMLNNQYWGLITRYGNSPETIATYINQITEQILNGDTEGIPKSLVTPIQQALAANNITSESSDYIKEKGLNYATQGLYSTIGKEMFNTLSNASYARPASDGGRKAEDLEGHNITTIYSSQGDAEERELLNDLIHSDGHVFSFNKEDYNWAETIYSLRYGQSLESQYNDDMQKYFGNNESLKIPIDHIMQTGGRGYDQETNTNYTYKDPIALKLRMKIIPTLLNNGYSTEQIQNMTASEMEQNIKDIIDQKESDLLGLQHYYLTMQPKDSKEILQSLATSGESIELVPITGTKKDNNGNITLVTGTSEPVTFRGDDADVNNVQITLNRATGEPCIVVNGKLYKMPMDKLLNSGTLAIFKNNAQQLLELEEKLKNTDDPRVQQLIMIKIADFDKKQYELLQQAYTSFNTIEKR